MHGIVSGPVIRTIHPDDHMFTFMRDHLQLPHDEAVEGYLLHGRETTDLLRDLLAEYGRATRPTSLLEFASGYGCVTRFMIEACPQLDVTCCDIHAAAIEFLRSQFGVKAVLSDAIPEKFILRRKFDVVFVISLFSHLPKLSWTRWLRRISQRVKRGGLLIFSTHGLTSAAHFNNPEIGEDGYWFHPVSEQNDLNPFDYGSTITTEAFVRKQLETMRDLQLLSFRPAALRRNQDIYIVHRLSLWREMLGRFRQRYGTS
jgi:SAM-dependent methyltransferase